MLSCPRCQHLNAPDEKTCELCGAELQPGDEELVMSEGPIGSLSSSQPAAPAQSPPSPSSRNERSSERSDDDSSGLTAALLDALEQDKEEGRARGEGPRSKAYMLKPLPIPDDIPAPNLGGGAPLAARVRESRSEIAVPSEPTGRIEAPSTGSERAVVHETVCPYCHTANPPNNRFCGGCGARLPSESGPVVAAQSAPPTQPTPDVEARLRVALVCINEDGSDGARIPLADRENVLGRASDARFASDAFLSPRHAKLIVTPDSLFVEDLDSLNGTFVRIREPVRLEPGDCFLMGRQVLRLERFEHQINPKARSQDGTRYMGSPIPSGQYKLLQVGIGGVIQNVYCVPAKGAILGRERGDITFPGDKFMSARHAQLTVGEEDEIYLSDTNSSNGTWTKIARRHPLRDQDFIFLGQQLFRIQVG